MLGVVVTFCVGVDASPVRFVLSLFYICAFQRNPVCVWLHLIKVCFFVCLFVTEVTNPNDWSVFVCVWSGQDLTRRPLLL